MEVRFVILSPSGKHRTTVKKLPLLVGRSEEAKLRINQDCVSRRHCEFVDRDGEVFVRDLTSTNGTIVDDEPIPPGAEARVRPGGVVKIGGATFRVDYGSGGTTAAALPAGSRAEAPPPPGSPSVPDTEPCGDEPPAPEVSDADDAADGGEGFGFLAAEPAAADVAAADWPAATEEPPAPAEGDLDDFFKSLS